MSWKPPPFDLEGHRREIKDREESAHKSDAEYEKLAKRDPRGPWWLRFYIWFAAFTVIYAFVASANLGPYGMANSDGAGNMVGNLIGLFVPIGPNNYILFMIRPLGWLADAIILFTVWRANRYLESSRPHTGEKIFWNLILLFGLTVLTDLLTIGWPASVGIFLHSF